MSEGNPPFLDKMIILPLPQSAAVLPSCTVQGAVLIRNRDVHVDDGLFFNDVVGLVVVVGLLQLVCLLAKQGSPHHYLFNSCIGTKRDS